MKGLLVEADGKMRCLRDACTFVCLSCHVYIHLCVCHVCAYICPAKGLLVEADGKMRCLRDACTFVCLSCVCVHLCVCHVSVCVHLCVCHVCVYICVLAMCV